jgi:hypothetical protein
MALRRHAGQPSRAAGVAAFATTTVVAAWTILGSEKRRKTERSAEALYLSRLSGRK